MFLRFVRLSWLLSAGGLLSACAGGGLDDGGVIRGDLTPDRAARLDVDLSAGQAVRLLVNQLDADLTLKVTSSTSGDVRVVDMRERGSESVTLIAVESAQFSVDVGIRDPAIRSAHYEARLDGPVRKVTQQDTRAAQAESLETSGKSLATDPRGSKADAERALEQASEHWHAIGEQIGMATTAARLGDIQFSRGQFSDAAARYREALTTLRPLGIPYLVASLENNLGATFEQRGDFDQARRHLREAIGIWSTLPGSEVDRAVAQSNEATMYLRFGDYQAARQAYLEALPVLEANRRLNPAVLNNLGVVHRAIGDVDAAIHYFQRAVGALPDGHPRRADLQLRAAQVAFDQNDAEAALRGVDEALATIRKSENPNPLIEADAYSLQGQVYAARGLPDKARVSLHEALRRYEHVQAKRHTAGVWHHLGTVSRQQRRTGEARSLLVRALEVRRALGLRDAEAETQYELGLVEAQAGHLARAAAHHSIAVDLIDGARGRVLGEYSRSVFLASRHRYFGAYIEVLMRRHGQQPAAGFAVRALEVVERQRARSLIDLVLDDGPVGQAQAEPAVVDGRRVVQRELDFWAGQLARLSNTGAADAEKDARERLMDALVRLREMDGRLRNQASGEVEHGVFGTEQLRLQLVDGRTRLVTYSLGDSRSYAWVISPDSVNVVVLPSAAVIETSATRLLDDVRQVSPEPGRSSDSDMIGANAAALAAMVIDPIKPWLDAERVLIAADGILQVVPFAALPVGTDGSLLVDRHEIAMIPSAGTVLAQRARKARHPPPSASIGVVADAVYESDDPRGRRRSGREAPGGFGRLMLARTEADWIQALAGRENTALMTGFEATREAVFQRLGSHRIVHLAAHAVADDDWPELSGIALSMFDRAGNSRDGMVRLHEISSNLSLRAHLVVLSACQGVAGRNLRGEGVMGLARGFVGAGASAVIASTHTVLEEPTVEFMKVLYSAIHVGQRPSQAMRTAQLAMRKHPRFSHPMYWSSFVFIGDPQ